MTDRSFGHAAILLAAAALGRAQLRVRGRLEPALQPRNSGSPEPGRPAYHAAGPSDEGGRRGFAMAEDRTDALARVPLFARLSKRQLRNVLEQTSEYEYDQGDV